MSDNGVVYLSRDQILGASDQKIQEVLIPEWGGTVKVRSLSGKERDQFEAESIDRRSGSVQANVINMRARLVALSAINGDGTRLFTDKDVAALGEKNAAALDRIFGIALKLSGIGKQDVEDLAKNSESVPSEDSIST